MKLTADIIMSLGPCREWPRERVEALLDTYGGEVEHVKLLRDPRVEFYDKEWLGRKLLRGNPALLRLYACTCAERAIWWSRAAGREPDPRSLGVVEVARRYARSEATDAELAAARFAAEGVVRSVGWPGAQPADPSAEVAAESAAHDAVWSARESVRSIASEFSVWFAEQAWQEEQKWQVERLIALINERES